MLPPLYAGWMETLLGGAVPEEREATCERCAMQVSETEARVPGTVTFTESKCCTYWPKLSPFLVGRILADETPDGVPARLQVECFLDARVRVTPGGISARSWFWKLYGEETFGRSQQLRCPYFDPAAGRCGVWLHRGAVCATWFCKFQRGAVGAAFWSALTDLLLHVERSLTAHCALALDLGCEALAALEEEEKDPVGVGGDGSAAEEQARRAWGLWAGRERDYYLESARLVAALSWPEVLAALGAVGRGLAAIVTERHEALQAEALPDGPLLLNSYRLVAARGEYGRIATYRDFDPLDVPFALLAALPRFDGRPTDEVVSEITACHGVTITPELVRTLTDFELLVPAGSSASPAGQIMRGG